MRDTESGLSGIADQRYYHFVALSTTATNSHQRFWQSLRSLRAPKAPVEWRAAAFQVEHKKLRSTKSYARGRVAEVLSQDGDGEPPYYYDIFAAHVTVRRSAYVLLGFPFAALALDIARDVLGAATRSPFGDFSRVDVPRLVRLMEKGSARHGEHLTTNVVSVQVSVRDDKSLTAVRLGGDDPLGAELYHKYLKARIGAGTLVPDHCVLACERQSTDDTSISRVVRSRLHIDRHGNLKFYVHVGCANLSLIAHALAQLDAMACLRRAESNPVFKLDEDDQVGR